MERLTHEADFGFEEWEQTLYSVNSDKVEHITFWILQDMREKASSMRF